MHFIGKYTFSQPGCDAFSKSIHNLDIDKFLQHESETRSQPLTLPDEILSKSSKRRKCHLSIPRTLGETIFQAAIYCSTIDTLGGQKEGNLGANIQISFSFCLYSRVSVEIGMNYYLVDDDLVPNLGTDNEANNEREPQNEIQDTFLNLGELVGDERINDEIEEIFKS